MEEFKPLIGNPNQSYLESQRISLIQDILMNVSQEGLHGSDEGERLRSCDKNHCGKLCVNLQSLKQRSSETFFQIWDPYSPLVHGEVNGMWSILLERQVPTPNSDRIEWEDRLQSSVLFILKPPEEDRFTFSDTVCKLPIMYCGQSSQIHEIQTKKQFSSDDMLAIICPKQLLGAVKKCFPTVKHCIGVDNYIKNNRVPSHKDAAKREGAMYLEGPDYICGIKKVVSLCSLDRFVTHVMRLPTRRDILQFYPEKLDKDACLTHYNTAIPEVALRRVAHKFGHREDIEYLGSSIPKLQVNAQDGNSTKLKTALHLACTRGDKSVIRALLSLGAAFNITDATQLTAQQCASQHGIQLGAINNVDTIADEEKTLFIERCRADPEIVKLALQGFSMDQMIGEHFQYSPGN